MALIKCYKCNHDVSNTIKKCIHCGARIVKPQANYDELNEAPQVIDEKQINIEIVNEKIPPIINNSKPTIKKVKLHKENKSINKLLLGLLILTLFIGGIFITYNFIFKDNNSKDNFFNATISNLRSVELSAVETRKGVLNDNEVIVSLEYTTDKDTVNADKTVAIYQFDIVNTGTVDISFELSNEFSFTDIAGDIFNVPFASLKITSENNVIKPKKKETVIFEIVTSKNDEKILLPSKYQINANIKVALSQYDN
jgi:hypothetical protein